MRQTLRYNPFDGTWWLRHPIALTPPLVGLLLLCLPARIVGQATEGTILGTVVDGSGAAVPGAAVTVLNLDKGTRRETFTNETGAYTASNLALGRYSVTVEAQGFRRATYPSVELTVKARVRVDLTLEIGVLSQEVEVSSASPLVKTDTPEVGGVITREELRELPVFGRNFLSLAALVPGTTAGPRDDRRRDLNGEAVTIGGASSEANNFIIDGISNNMDFSGAAAVIPAIDAIQEFAVQTSQYSAEFGRSGGGVVNVAIRSGSNKLHGFAYDYLRHDKLDARPYDFTGTRPPKQHLRRNQFGAGAGGPIFRDRTFFFGNYEGIRFPRSGLTQAIVPTASEKRGDFSQSGFSIFDPATTRIDPANPSRRIRTQFPGNAIPQSQFDPITVRLLSFFPESNYTDPNPAVKNNYLGPLDNNDDLNSYNVRIDQNLSKQDTMAVRYSEQRGGRFRSGFLPGNRIGATGTLDATNTGINYTHVFGPTQVNEARFGYNYLRFGNEMVVHENILSEFNIPGIARNPASDGFPQLSMRNITGTNVVRPIESLPTPFYLVEHSFQWLDTFSWQRDNHALKFGAEFVRHRSDRFQGLPGNATLQFDGTYTTQVVGQTLETARNGVPDALLGLANRFTTQFVSDAARLRSSRFGAFAQDDWRVTRNLTLNLGLRYDVFTPYGELRDRLTNFDFATGQRTLPDSTRGIVESVLGIPGGNLPSTFQYAPRGSVVQKTNWLDFSPRFGFAYAFNHRLVVRGGYGIFYGITVSNYASNQAVSPPFLTNVPLAGELDAPIVISNGFPVGSAIAPLSERTLGSTYQPLRAKDPYTQKYSLNVQASPFRNTAVEVGYTGQRALAYSLLIRLNVPLPAPGNIQDRRPYPNLGEGRGHLPVNDANYNGLEITVRQQETYGLSIHSTFTFSKALGYSSGIGTEGTATDAYNLRYDYGPNGYDMRKRWVTGWIYSIPSIPHLPAPLRFALHGWQGSGIVLMQGGFPFSVGVSGHVLNIGAATSRADVLRDPNLPVAQRTRDRWFDTSAFRVPAPYTWGNQGRNLLRGPGLAQVDFALQKSFPFAEARRVTIRMEAENLFNRVNLGPPAATLGAANFGIIRSTDGGPRHIQMALRLEF
jgi:Carboxypeptidase regulatory-like domain/TonB-dependent Receptor Plug Domain